MFLNETGICESCQVVITNKFVSHINLWLVKESKMRRSTPVEVLCHWACEPSTVTCQQGNEWRNTLVLMHKNQVVIVRTELCDIISKFIAFGIESARGGAGDNGRVRSTVLERCSVCFLAEENHHQRGLGGRDNIIFTESIGVKERSESQ